MFSLHNLLIKHFVCQNNDRGINKPVYLIKPFLQFSYCNMYDITQFLPFINLVASYVVFDIPFNTCAAGRQRFGENCHMLPSVKVVSKLSQRGLKVVSRDESKLCQLVPTDAYMLPCC